MYKNLHKTYLFYIYTCIILHKINIITYKIKYTTDSLDYIQSCIKDYNKILKYTYKSHL